MENQDKTTRQSKGSKVLKLLGKLLIRGIALAIILAMAFLSPLPFIRPMWQADIARWRMHGAVSRRVIGLSEYEVRAMLGAPPFSGRSNGQRAFSYPLRFPARWMHLIIIFSSHGTVESVWRGNPAHFGLGG